MKTPMRIALVCMFLAFFISSETHAEQYKYKEYTVKKGDTLWDISLSELEDNFQWPMIWKENLRINNPDLIYPGQVIRIPVAVITQDQGRIEFEKAPGPERAAPMEASVEKPAPKPKVVKKAVVKKKKKKTKQRLSAAKRTPIVSRQQILLSGYITNDIPYRGEITSSHTGRSKLFGNGDEVYIKTVEPASDGQKFYIIRKDEFVRHPITKKDMGYIVRVIGTIEALEDGKRDVKAVITELLDEIKVGDVLDDYYEIDIPFATKEPRRPEIEAYVLATKQKRELNAIFDIVFIDKGEADDILPSDVVLTLMRGTNDRRNGVLQIVNTREKSSLAVIKKSESNVKAGDFITNELDD